jgi:hypothetical protein
MAYGGSGAASMAAMAPGMNMSTTAPAQMMPKMKPKCGSTGAPKVYDLPLHVVGLCMFTNSLAPD